MDFTCRYSIKNTIHTIIINDYIVKHEPRGRSLYSRDGGYQIPGGRKGGGYIISGR
jgi:hypothetical protein